MSRWHSRVGGTCSNRSITFLHVLATDFPAISGMVKLEWQGYQMVKKILP